MCEIAVVDPERTGLQASFQLASQLYEEQGDGLGVVAVKRDEENERFRYEVYKSAQPHWQRLWAFMRRVEDKTWRFILHARAMTDGDVNRQNTHPLKVDCEHCQTQYLVHNGVVHSHKSKKADLKEEGHTFNTEVDSEVIAHGFGEEVPVTPEAIEEAAPDLSGSLNYILLTETHIAARFEQKYHITDDFVVSCNVRKHKEPFSDVSDMKNDAKWVSVMPDGEMEKKKRTRWYGRTSKYNTGRSGTGKSRRSSVRSKNSSTNTATASGSDIIAETYEDLVPRLEGIQAIKVAPGVIKVIESKDGETTREEFIKRRDEPALYSYFATDENYPTDEWMDLRELFDDDGNLKNPDNVESKVVRETTQQTIEKIVNEGGDEEAGNSGDFR